MTDKQTVKALDGNKIGGYIVAFGSPVDKDLDGDYFTKDTNFELDWYNVRPVLYSHGMDPSHKTAAIGHIYKIELKEDAGLWAEAQLREEFLYREYVDEWLAEGRLGWSSGTSEYCAEFDKDGFIRTWPIQEGSLTLRPAQPEKTKIFVIKHFSKESEIKKAVKELGLTDYDLERLMVKDKNDEGKDVETTLESVKEEVILADSEEVVYNDKESDYNTPIEVHNHIHIDLAEQKESIISKDNKDIIMEQKEQRVEEVPSVAKEQPAEQPQVLKEPVIRSVSDSSLSDMVIERMWARKSRETNNAEQMMGIARIKDWFKQKYLLTDIKEEHLQAAKSNPDFQSFLNDLVDGLDTPQEAAASSKEDERIKALEAQLKEIQAMAGQGGKSQLPMNDGKQSSRSMSDLAFHFDPEYRAKQNFLNYSFDELASYASLRFEALDKKFIRDDWPEERTDALLAALYDQGKDTMPKIKHLLSNPNWRDRDRDETPYAWNAFEMMYQQDRRKTIKTDEIFHSTNTGRGAEWIYTLPDAVMWQTMLETTQVASLIPTFVMTAGEVERYIDDEMGMPKVIPEARNAATTGANDITRMTLFPVETAHTESMKYKARHIGFQSFITKVSIEDAIIDPVALTRRHMEHSMRRGIDWTLLNADLYSGNPNKYDQHERSGSAVNDNYGHYGVDVDGSAHTNELYNIGFEGLIARALRRSDDKQAGLFAGADNCVDRMRAVRRMLTNRYYADRGSLRIIMSPELCDKLMDLEDFKMASRYSGNWDAGGETFQSFDGTPIIKSEQLVLRDEEGRLHSTAANNEYENIIFFRPDRMEMGIRRRMARTMQEWGPTQEELRLFTSLRYDFQTIPNAATGANGSGLIRKPVSVLYGISA